MYTRKSQMGILESFSFKVAAALDLSYMLRLI